jgi:hypothetical protein
MVSARRGPSSPTPWATHRVRNRAPPLQTLLGQAGLVDSEISLRWCRCTGATIIARGMGSDAAAAFLGHSSTAITEGHYIEARPDYRSDPAGSHVERTLPQVGPPRLPQQKTPIASGQ